MKSKFELYSAAVVYSLAIGSAIPWPGQATFSMLFLIAALIATTITATILFNVRGTVDKVIEDIESNSSEKSWDKARRRISFFYGPLIVIAAFAGAVTTAIMWTFVLFTMLAMETAVKQEYSRREEAKN